MDVKFLIADATSPLSLGQMVSTVGSQGETLVGLEAALGSAIAKETALFLMGGRHSLVNELSRVPDGVALNTVDHGTIIVDFARMTYRFKKDKTIIQVRDINALGCFFQVADNSHHIAYSIGERTTTTVTMNQLGSFLESQWDIAAAGPA